MTLFPSTLYRFCKVLNRSLQIAVTQLAIVLPETKGFERSHKLIRGFMLSHFHLFLQASLQAVNRIFQRLVDIVAAMGLAFTAPKIVELNKQLA